MAESYARIFFRNCIATGECYPYECPGIRLCEEIKTGDEVRCLDLGRFWSFRWRLGLGERGVELVLSSKVSDPNRTGQTQPPKNR